MDRAVSDTVTLLRGLVIEEGREGQVVPEVFVFVVLLIYYGADTWACLYT